VRDPLLLPVAYASSISKVILSLLIMPSERNRWSFSTGRLSVAAMFTILSAMASLVSFRFRRRVSLELEVLALRHQLAVLHRQRPGRAWLGRGDRQLWGWLYRIWPRCLEVMVLVKPATVVQWHRQGFRKYWHWRSRSRRAGRPEVNCEIRELIRQMSIANPLWGGASSEGWRVQWEVIPPRQKPAAL
jgi:hypothetical protein